LLGAANQLNEYFSGLSLVLENRRTCVGDHSHACLPFRIASFRGLIVKRSEETTELQIGTRVVRNISGRQGRAVGQLQSALNQPSGCWSKFRPDSCYAATKVLND
jgi:hypothetical protein